MISYPVIDCFSDSLPSGRTAYPLNPTAVEVEGYLAFATITELPVVPESLLIVTPLACSHVSLPNILREIFVRTENMIVYKPSCRFSSCVDTDHK